MENPKNHHSLNLMGKKAAPILAYIFLRRPFIKGFRLLESYLAFIEGKGAGAGWDIRSEARIAVQHIHRPEAVIFDVGAHHGMWSQNLVKALGPGYQCRLFEFEPLKSNQDKLRTLDLPRTELIEAAVGDKSGDATIFTPDSWSPVASLYARKESYLQQYTFIEEKVKVVTIDEIMQNYSIDYVDFMKLDVEGHELFALLGGQTALKSGRIKALTFEFGSGNINSRTYFRDFWDLLHPIGYVIRRICPGGQLIEIDEYYEDLEYFRSVTNYLAISQ